MEDGAADERRMSPQAGENGQSRPLLGSHVSCVGAHSALVTLRESDPPSNTTLSDPFQLRDPPQWRAMRIQLDPLKVVAKADNFRILTTYARQNEPIRKSMSTHPPAERSTFSGR